MRKSVLLASAVAIGAFSTAANATVVTSIKITSDTAPPTYLQVAELIATQAGTGTDVALASNGGIATALSSYSSFATPDKAIDGNSDGDYNDQSLYHSGGPYSSEFLLVTLGQAYNLSGLTIFGRTDGGVSYRDSFTYTLYNGTNMVGTGALDATGLTHSASVSFDTGGAVPEPASWALMLGGFGAIGGALRVRKRATVRFA
jgi:hypothetical protein